MKIRAILLSGLFASVILLPAMAQQSAKVTPSGIGYLEYLPDGYHSNNNKYPVVISLHGYKEKGTSSTDPKQVQRDLPRAAYVGLAKYVRSGEKYPFILISPQLKSQYSTWPPSFIMEVLRHVKKTLRIDESRIYLTGLSLGGFGVWKTAGDYPNEFAAIAPICSGGNALDKAQAIAKANVAVWAFHGSSDHVVSHTVTTKMVTAINSAPKKPDPLAKVTIFPNMGHNVWDKAYQQTDLLKWMLTIRKGSDNSSEPANIPPVVNAGGDKTIQLPQTSLQLQGTSTDKDGKVTAYQWSQVSGVSADIKNTTSPTLSISGLREGVYRFRLVAKDDAGASDSDEATVTVKARATESKENTAPVVNAGTDKSLILPENAIVLQAQATDNDGSVVSYQWTQISGAPAQTNGANTRTLNVTSLQKGTYAFKVVVQDDDGATAADAVTVNVSAKSTSKVGEYPLEPIANDVTKRRTPSIKTVTFPGKPWLIGN